MQILLSKNLVLSIHRFAYTVDYTGGEEVRANLLKGRSSAKPEAHESLAHG
jgi:putative transposase